MHLQVKYTRHLERIGKIVIDINMEFNGYSEDSHCFAKYNERLRMINYQYIVKAACQNNFLVGCKEALISDCSRRAEKAVDQAEE